MIARRKLRRRIDDALAVASPLALAEAMDAHVAGRSRDDLRGLIARSAKRMESGDRQQLELYVNLDDADDLLGHRFSAFLRQNPRAIAALDAEAIDEILAELGQLPQVEHFRRRLSPRAAALVAAVFAIALLPLAAQYAHQRGLVESIAQVPAAPPVIVPFVEAIAAHPAARVQRHRAPRVSHVAKRPVRRAAIVRRRERPVRRRVAAVFHPRPKHVSAPWKFSPANNPYFNRSRWRHPYVADASPFGLRARLSVRAYLRAIVDGNLTAALAHLGMPPSADRSAIAELPIVSRGSSVAIVGSKPKSGGKEQVQADIVTAGREYYEVFDVQRDGPAVRIVDRYYIPVNRRAQLAMRSLVSDSH